MFDFDSIVLNNSHKCKVELSEWKAQGEALIEVTFVSVPSQEVANMFSLDSPLFSRIAWVSVCRVHMYVLMGAIAVDIAEKIVEGLEEQGYEVERTKLGAGTIYEPVDSFVSRP